MASADSGALSRRPLRRGLLPAGLLLGLLALVASAVVSVGFGTVDVEPTQIWAALVASDGSTEHVIIRTIRLPRAMIAVSVGASLAVAGAVMQGITRNPLASPGILGVNAGAALAVVVAIFLLDSSSLATYAWFAFGGAGIAAVAVYGLASMGRGGPTPLKLTVAGAAIAALLSSLTTGILIVNQRTLDEVRFWLAGSIAGRDLNLFLQVAPYLAFGMAASLLMGRQITTLALGDDVATGLGQRTAWVKAIAVGCVVLLAGGSVAVAGPIGFVGLVVPHVARFFVGADYRWILPYAAVLGGIFLVLADVAARLVVRPQEIPVGAMTALIGGPFFVYLVRWKVRR